MSVNDSMNLWTIANGCPYLDGAVVHQARAMWNAITNRVVVFEDNCTTTNNGRMALSVKRDKQEDDGIKVYPNPNDGSFWIEVTGEKLEKETIQIRMIDVIGKEVKVEYDLKDNGGIINVKGLAVKGVYLLEVKCGKTGRAWIKKVVVE